MVTKQKDLRDDRRRFFFLCGNKRVAQFSRIQSDPEDVAGNFSFWRQNDNSAWMRVLMCLRIVRVTKACLICECCDGALVAHEKMPAICRAVATVLPEVRRFFLRCSDRRFCRVDTDVDHLEVSTCIQRQLLECVDQPIIDQGTEH